MRSFLLNYLLIFYLVTLSSTEPNLKAKIDGIFGSKNLTSATNMCKLKHDLKNICKEDAMMEIQTSCKDIHFHGEPL